MKKITFAVGDLQMGGSMRVQSVIANHLDKKNFDVSIFSMRKVKSYFPLNVKLTYAKHGITKLQFYFILIRTGILKYILKKPVDMTVIPTKKMVTDLIEYANNENVDTLILVEQWAVVAKELKKSLPNVKIISWLHLNTKIYESFLYGKSYSRLKDSYFYSDLIMVLTKEDQIHLKSLGLDSTMVMHNPLTIDNHNSKANLDSKNISFVGRIDFQHKGLDYLVEIAKNLQEGWKIYVAGKGMKHEEKKFQKAIIDNNLENKLLWTGSKNGKELKNHFENSSIFISTSRFEGFPLVFAEAMSFGLPIISMSNSGSEEVLDGGKYGVLTRQGDIADFLSNLEEMQNTKELREKYSYRSTQRLEDLKLEKIILKWEEILAD
ncbi:glycosyltransferase [Lactococcus lactis]|jgi:Glycosyltransferase|uniref:glycosyltransferase n=1 Tax=Lactococcus lactis TaxID=1358 RepID=UPI00071E1944|nr:glycosyltransferase [Lactococcus lactis]MCT0437596.1 glycosyltransferase [Lactococcus lactis subsp. lactis]MCT2919864.1 glycosyltransferase [Lactococcus lactis]MDG4990153.1 glycosyltransferase [Lactococcus lactis]NLS46894.1 glycosyltransferase [Lactococcus lactis]QBC37620.1 glycosyltransferase [Lactococcus lactis]